MKSHSTTILSVRRGGTVAIGGDGQATLGTTIAKSDVRKIRKLLDGQVIAGFAGSAWWFAAGYYKILHLTFVAFFVAGIVEVVVSLITKEPPEYVQKMVEELRDKA